MSEGMFLGRKFTIPYDTTTDQHTASMARAQMITRTATPGTVIQVGDTVLAYGVTPQQAKMGDLDVRLRSFEQLSNQAQESVRQNIQWQYGEQVGEADPMKKGLIARMFGVPQLSKPFEVLYPPVKPGAKPNPAAVGPAATPAAAAAAAPAAPSTPAPSAAPTSTAAPAPAPKKAAASSTKKPKSKGTAPAAAPIPTPVPATGKKAATSKPPAAEPSEPFGREIPDRVQTEMITAFQTLAHRHQAARTDGWTTELTFSGSTARSTATHGPSNAREFHEVSYVPKSGGFVHRYQGPLMKKPEETALDSTDALYNHVASRNEKWAF